MTTQQQSQASPKFNINSRSAGGLLCKKTQGGNQWRSDLAVTHIVSPQPALALRIGLVMLVGAQKYKIDFAEVEN